MNSFVALDVETANPNQSSICAIGAARYEGGLVVEEWYRLIDPCDEFGAVHMNIHGIRPEDVVGKPRFAQLVPEMQEFVDDRMVVHHGHFDRNAIIRASERWRVPPPEWSFRDSAQMARLAWPQFSKKGYNLANLCQEIGHELVHHHNALDDARAAGAVYIEATKRLGIETDGVQGGFWPDYDELLVGEVVVFSQGAGQLSRRADVRRALQLCQVNQRLNERTTIFVASDPEYAGERTTAQLQAARRRIRAGQRLSIRSATDFLAMIEHG